MPIPFMLIKPRIWRTHEPATGEPYWVLFTGSRLIPKGSWRECIQELESHLTRARQEEIRRGFGIRPEFMPDTRAYDS